MTPEKQALLTVKGAISELPAMDAEACRELAEHLRRTIEQAGEPVGLLALALVVGEFAVEREGKS